jgi:hypothetical protein
MQDKKQTKKEAQEAEQGRLGGYIQDYRDAWEYAHNNYHSKWYECYSVYNNSRVKIGYNAIADAFVPETRTIVESLVANIAGGQPKFEYIPTNEEQEVDTEVLTELMDYYWDCNHMGVKAQSWVRDSTLYGTGVLHVTWNAKENRPQIDNVPLRDFFVDPTATCLENARFAGFRYLADIETLKGVQIIDPETGTLSPKYKNLDKIRGDALSQPTAQEMDKQKKEQLFGSTLGTNNERQVEVILTYYMDTGKVVEVANRTQIIREVDTPFQLAARTRKVEVATNGVPSQTSKELEKIDPFLPFAILRNTIDSSLFYGTGDVEVIMDRQETLNDIENLDLDNLHFMNNVMWRIDPAYEDMAAEIESSPGIVIPVPRFALEPIEKPRIDNDLDNKKMEIKEEMRRATAADEVMQGAVSQGGRTTATEISAVTTQAQARFKTKVTNLESEGFAQLGSIMFKLTQIFLDQKTVVRIVGPEGVAFKDYDPFEYSGYYEPHVRLSSTVKEEKIEQGQKLNQMYQVILNNPVVDQREAVRFIMKTLGADDDEIKRMLDVQQQAGGDPAQAAMMGGNPNPMMPDGGQMFDPQVAGMMRAREDFAQSMPTGMEGGTSGEPQQAG